MRRPLPYLLLSLALVALSAFSTAWVRRDGPAPPAAEARYHRIDLQANVFTSSAQEQVALDGAADGSTVVTWASRRQERGSYGIYARAIDPFGRPATHEVHVNATLRGQQVRPAVAVTPEGAWFAWESLGQDGSGSAVVARRFDRWLEPLGGELAVNVEVLGDQSSPSLTAAADGGALVAWTHASRGEGPRPEHRTEVRIRRLGADGGASSEPVTLSSPGRSRTPVAATLPDGSFVVAWARSGDDGGIYARRVDRDGAPLGAERQLVAAAEGSPVEPSLAVDGDGRWIVAWLERHGESYAVASQRFSSDGEPLGARRLSDRDPKAWRSGVAVAAADDGRYLVSYTREAAGDATRLFGHEFDARGRALGTPQPIRQAARRVGADGDETVLAGTGARRSVWTSAGRLAFAWQGDAGTGDSAAAHLSLRLPVGVAAPPARDLGSPQIAREVTSAEFLTAAVPIWNPDFVRLERRPPGELIGGDFGFEAVTNTGWTPPDPEMAVGPEQVIVMTNGEIAAFDKLGNRQWADEIENSFGFWGELGTDNFVFDPEATWDPHARRFVVMANERSDSSRSNFLLAVSKDERPDDRDDWHKYRLDVTDLASNDIDSPNLALSRDHILLTADFFGPDRYLLYIIDKDSVLEGGSPVTIGELITGSQSMGIPVVYSDTATLYIVQAGESFAGDNDTITLHAVTDPFTDYDRTTFTLAVPPYATFPADPPQRDSGVRPELFESRFWSVAEQNGAIWAVHHVGADRARVQWYEIELNDWPSGGNPSLAQEGRIDLGGGIYTFFPSIHVDADDNVAITFARSATNEYFSIGRAVRTAADPSGFMRPAQVVQTSQNASTSGRWGDYSGTQADPQDDDTFWGHHEFTDSGASTWRTWVARYDVRPEPMRLSLDGPLVAGQPLTMEVTGATPNGDVYFVFGLDGTGLTEVAPLNMVLSLESVERFRSVTADANGDASLTVNVPPDFGGVEVTIQAAEQNRTTNWFVRTVQ